LAADVSLLASYLSFGFARNGRNTVLTSFGNFASGGKPSVQDAQQPLLNAAWIKPDDAICPVTAMVFTLFRYGLLPVVLFCGVVVCASVDAYWSNAVQKATWRQTVATVVASQDFGDVAARFRGTPNTFPDPRGTVTYVADGATYTWRGRGRDIGVTVMNPGEQINIAYNPRNPRQINTLVLLGASTGNIILATALAFLTFYVWFFWVRGFLRRPGPDDFGGDKAVAFADSARAPATTNRLTGSSFDRGSRTRFGKR
jgi:hypothetical protein